MEGHNMDNSALILLGFLRASLGNEFNGEGVAQLSVQEWQRLVRIAFEHGVAALAMDGFGELQINSLIHSDELEDLRYQWSVRVIQTEVQYEDKFIKASKFAEALKKRGAKCMVLKGMSFATYYRQPKHRESGDCDVYLGADWNTGNELAVKMGGRYEFGTYKHSHLSFGGLLVENHRYLTDFNATKQGKKIEKLLERVIADCDGRYIEDSYLVCPSDYFNALFLIKHAHGNFMDGGLTLRMLYDWAALLMCCHDRLDWSQLNVDLSECKLLRFASLMTSLCVKFFGVDPSNLGIGLCDDDALVNEVMEDTISGGINAKGVENFPQKSIRICQRFLRIWHYRTLATETVPRMIWNNFAFSSYMKRKIEM